MVWHRIVLGIGNPGPEYEDTRHNAGFLVLDHLARLRGLEFRRLERRDAGDGVRFSGKVKARIAEGKDRQGRPFLLVKPLTYVNLSGEVAAPLLRHCGLSPESLFVVVDDLNLPLGRIKVRPSGSAGGHNGLKSIQQSLGSDAFPRLRLGIGRAGESQRIEGVDPSDWADYVLAPFLPEEREVLGLVLGRATGCVEAWLDGTDLQTLMGTYNHRPDAGPAEGAGPRP